MHPKNIQLNINPLPPLSLYVHFPWCIKKCPYCDFNSYEIKNNFLEEEYLSALCIDINLSLPLILGRKIISIFIGGGTPSLLSIAGLNRLLTHIYNVLPIQPNTEISIEANPETFEVTKFKAFYTSGINRLSIGVQSLNNTHLLALGRTYNSKQAQYAIEIAHTYFHNFNIDMMYGLPSQTIDDANHDLSIVLQYMPTHLSLYHLTLEPNTLFAKYPPSTLPTQDTSAIMQEMLTQQTINAGYMHYEVSAYAKRGYKACHNLNYWKFGDYLGIGAGSHSKLSFQSKIVRQVRYKNPVNYIKHSHLGNTIYSQTTLDSQTLSFEFMLNALRLRSGFSANLFIKRTGLCINTISHILCKAQEKKLLHKNKKIIRPTKLGYRFLNDLQEMFLTEKDKT